MTDPGDYGRILGELRASGGAISLGTRFDLCRKAFAHTADYDAAISSFFAGQDFESVSACYVTG